jgi:hypothetical protein
MDYRSSINACENAIRILDIFVTVSDAELASTLMTELDAAMEKVWPKLPKHAKSYIVKATPSEEKAEYFEWMEKLGFVLDRADVATSKIKDTNAINFFASERRKYEAERASTHTAQPDEVELPATDTLKVIEVESFEDPEFTKVQAKGKGKAKEKTQRSQVAHRVVFSPTPSVDMGTDVGLESAERGIGFTFPVREQKWQLAFQPARWGFINEDGKHISRAKASKEEKAKAKPVKIEDEVYFDLQGADKDLIGVLRRNQLMCMAHYTYAYRQVSSTPRTILSDEEVELTKDSAEEVFGEDEIQFARVSYWAAQAEAKLKDHSRESSCPMVQELFSRLAYLPKQFNRAEAARMWVRFLEADLVKGTNPNKSIATMRNSMYASWRQGESKDAYCKRVRKTVIAVWGKTDATSIEASFRECFDYDIKPKQTTKIAALKAKLAKAAPKAATFAAATGVAGMSYAKAAKKAVVADFKEAKRDVPMVGLRTWFRSWLSGKVSVSVENARAARRAIKSKNLFSRAWHGIKTACSKVYNKTVDVTPTGMKGASVLIRVPRWTYMWCKTATVNAIRWFGRQLYNENDVPLNYPPSTILFDGEVDFTEITLGAPTGPQEIVGDE